MKSLCLWLVLPGVLMGQIPAQPGSAINRKIDLNSPALATPEGVAFWYEGKAYHGANLVEASLDGSRVTIRANDGTLEAEWKKLPAEAKGKFFAQYQAVVARVKAEVAAALEAEQEKKEMAEGIRTYRNAIVAGASSDGLLLLLADSGEQMLLRGHPLQANLVADDRVSFKAKDDGNYKAGGEIGDVPALKYVGGVKE